MMNQVIEQFCAECIELAGDDRDGLRAMFAALENEAAGNPNAAAFLGAVVFIAAEQGRSPVEKLTAMHELASLRGRHSSLVHINSLREFCGWRS